VPRPGDPVRGGDDVQLDVPADEDCTVEGKLWVRRFMPDGDTARLLTLIDSARVPTDIRTSGLVTRTATFGFLPRRALRCPACMTAGLARKDPPLHDALVSLGAVAWSHARACAPEQARAHELVVRQTIRDEWLMPTLPATSGVFNRDSQLAYHRDGSNLKGSWSMQLAWGQFSGGALHIADLSTRVQLDHSQLITFVLFEGGRWLHGVEPFGVQVGGARTSLVYYARRAMADCQSPAEELIRLRAERVRREELRARPREEQEAHYAKKP
jgi:hypothetical protein